MFFNIPLAKVAKLTPKETMVDLNACSKGKAVKSKKIKINKEVASKNVETDIKPKDNKSLDSGKKRKSKHAKETFHSKSLKTTQATERSKKDKSSKDLKTTKTSKKLKMDKNSETLKMDTDSKKLKDKSERSKAHPSSKEPKESRDNTKTTKEDRHLKKPKEMKVSPPPQACKGNSKFNDADNASIDANTNKVPVCADENYFSQPKATTGLPFRRVDPNIVDVEDVKSFSQYKDPTTTYGDKAFSDLRPTRGKDFRHEKNKKKKGSYRGGFIDTGIHSIRFD